MVIRGQVSRNAVTRNGSAVYMWDGAKCSGEPICPGETLRALSNRGYQATWDGVFLVIETIGPVQAIVTLAECYSRIGAASVRIRDARDVDGMEVVDFSIDTDAV